MNKATKYIGLAANLSQRALTKRSGRVAGLPVHIQIEITNGCNLQCLSCHRDLLYPKATTMSFENLRKVFDDIRPIKINVSGIGEPFMNKDAFRMIRYAKEHGAAVNCATNFTLVGGKVEKIVDSGIDQLKVSIDAADPETYHRIRKKDLHGVLVENLRELSRVKKERGADKPTVRFNYALQKENLDELVPTVRLAKELDVGALYVQYLTYVDRENRKEKLVGDMTRGQLEKTLGEAEALAGRLGIITNISMWWREFEYFWNNMQPLPDVIPNKKHCYFPWFSTWIDADGTVRPCPVIPWRKGVAHMGNAFEENFSRIWNNEKYQEFRVAHAKGERPNSVCKECIPVSLATIFQINTKLLPK